MDASVSGALRVRQVVIGDAIGDWVLGRFAQFRVETLGQPLEKRRLNQFQYSGLCAGLTDRRALAEPDRTGV